VAGGSSVSLSDVITLLEAISGDTIPIERHPVQSGDVSRTGGSTERARALLGWSPQVSLRHGLERQLEWHRTHRYASPATESRS
jgi:nucleoside-diphosphate-sugar epimerase